MAHTITQEERQIIKLVEKLPVTAEEKASWSERIHAGEMGEPLAEEIRARLTTPPEGQAPIAPETRARLLVEVSNLVRRWRLTYQARNFGRR